MIWLLWASKLCKTALRNNFWSRCKSLAHFSCTSSYFQTYTTQFSTHKNYKIVHVNIFIFIFAKTDITLILCAFSIMILPRILSTTKSPTFRIYDLFFTIWITYKDTNVRKIFIDTRRTNDIFKYRTFPSKPDCILAKIVLIINVSIHVIFYYVQHHFERMFSNSEYWNGYWLYNTLASLTFSVYQKYR